MTVESLRLRLVLIAPLRLLLSVAWLGAARAAGSPAAAALLTFAAGLFAAALLVSNDPRARFRAPEGGPAPLPAGARVAPAWAHVLHAAFPSTVGVSLLAATTLAFQPTLAALLGGILAGLGVAAGLAAYGMDRGLYLDPRSRVVFHG